MYFIYGSVAIFKIGKKYNMSDNISFTGERIGPEDFTSIEKYFILLLHKYNYKIARENISPNNNVLEVGCGEGFGTNFLSPYAKKIVGIDVDKNIIEHCNKKYTSSNCSFKHYDGYQIPFSDNSFDTVISFQVIEHVQDDINFISEAHRVLKNGGKYILTTPNKTTRIKKGKKKPWNRFHIREYNAIELKKLMEKKFSKVDMKGINATEDIYNSEHIRIKKAIFVDSLDPLNLRNLIPESITPFIIKLIRKISGLENRKKLTKEILKKYSVDDYKLEDNNFDKSIHLLSICKK